MHLLTTEQKRCQDTAHLELGVIIKGFQMVREGQGGVSKPRKGEGIPGEGQLWGMEVQEHVIFFRKLHRTLNGKSRS